MIKLRTMIPIVTALTLSTAAMQSCNILKTDKEEKTELVSNPTEDTFEKEGKMDIPFTLETIGCILGLITLVCGIFYLKNPTEAKKHLFKSKQNINDANGEK